MAPRKRVAAEDSSSEDEINLDKMIETKDELNKVSSMPCLPFALLCCMVFLSDVDSPDPQGPRGKTCPTAEGPREEAHQPVPTHQADR